MVLLRKVAIVLVVALSVLLPLEAASASEDCSALTHDPTVEREQVLRCVVNEVARTDDQPFIWLWVSGGAAIVGAAGALVLLRRTSESRAPRSEDEAWADLLGEGA
jgi:hypothetical protein